MIYTDRSALFLDKYRELEAVISAEYNLSDRDSPVSYLMRRKEYRALKPELDYCREVRNLLSHTPKVNDRYAVEPSEEMLALLDRLIARVRNSQRAQDILVPRAQVCCRTLKDPLLPALREMHEKRYTHIPIVKNNVVVGVFSETTLLEYVIHRKSFALNEQMTFADMAEYLPIGQHRGETFLWVGKDVPAADIEALFAQTAKNGGRVGLIFVTAHGKPTEKLLGIISAWDVAGVY